MSAAATGLPTARGLSSHEARRRLAETGPNEIRRASGTPAWRLFATVIEVAELVRRAWSR